MNTTALTAKILLVRVDDREGNGRCGACQREGLRWICVLSDGTEVGTECAKAALGYKPTPKTYAWVMRLHRSSRTDRRVRGVDALAGQEQLNDPRNPQRQP